MSFSSANPRRVIVLGAGVTGITTAWYLAEAGLDVSVIERQPQAGQESSYANGGQISVSHPEPWAGPATLLNVLRWLGRRDAPVRLRPQADLAQWRWIAAFLHECLPHRHRSNTRAIAKLACYSLACLQHLRTRLDLDYEQQTRGILHVFRHTREWAAVEEKRERLAALGIPGRICSAAECRAIDPALEHLAPQLLGGFYAPGDESGNARLFTQALAERARERGVFFHYSTLVKRLRVSENNALAGVDIIHPDGSQGVLSAEAYVLCFGCGSQAFMATVGDNLPVYPLKGYSATIPVLPGGLAPVVSLTDESLRIVCSRLGEQLRVAGTADIAGYDTTIDSRRCGILLRWAQEAFPDALDIPSASLWAGLRPATPGNIPLIGQSRHPCLWYNTGHGSLGWTLACGAASCLAKLLTGERVPVEGFPFLRAAAR